MNSCKKIKNKVKIPQSSYLELESTQNPQRCPVSRDTRTSLSPEINFRFEFKFVEN